MLSRLRQTLWAAPVESENPQVIVIHAAEQLAYIHIKNSADGDGVGDRHLPVTVLEVPDDRAGPTEFHGQILLPLLSAGSDGPRVATPGG